MSKAFITENDEAPEDDFEEPDPLPPDTKNYMTPKGAAALQEELRFLLKDERPKIVEIVSWAAGNGDRSENGDYIYNKKRLREIDRRVRYLMKRLDNYEVVDPRKQQGLEAVYFGATVTYAREDGTEVTVTLVGVDEADMNLGKINWQSPVGRALLKKKVDDTASVRLAEGVEELEIISIEYRLDN
ncbi:MAG: transcription elongation factor GreB [Alphaproteobacteria bacterium]|nr:transcription elongation factor GreB [Alphaproteobacteria bacterium]